MNRWLIPLGSLTAIVIGVVAVLALAGVFDSDSASPGDGQEADTSALCVEGAEDCDDTVAIPDNDGNETASPPPASSGDGTPLDSGPTQPVLDPELDDDRALAIQAALAALDAMGVPPTDDIEVTEVRDVDWPNACLGVETPGVACAQVITPGFVIVINAGSGPYTFHADRNGHAVLADPAE